MNTEFVRLEDGKNCILLDEFVYQNNTYVILVNSLNKDDFIVRKVEDNNLIGLDDENHFKEVFEYYFKTKIKNGLQ